MMSERNMSHKTKCPQCGDDLWLGTHYEIWGPDGQKQDMGPVDGAYCLTRQLTQARETIGKLRAVASKILLCFPDDDDPHEFIIPYYITDELRAALEPAKPSNPA